MPLPLPWRMVSLLRFTLVEQPPRKLPGTFLKEPAQVPRGSGWNGSRRQKNCAVVFLWGGDWAGSLGRGSVRPGIAAPPVSSQLPPLAPAPPICLLSLRYGICPRRDSHRQSSAEKYRTSLPVNYMSCPIHPSLHLPCTHLFLEALVCIPVLPDLMSISFGGEWRGD